MSMTLYDKLADVFAAHKDLCFFAGAMTEQAITSAESRLGVTFPESYRWFCKNYGAGSFGSEEFYGLTYMEPKAVPSVIFCNESARRYGNLPNSIIIVWSSGSDWQCGLDLTRCQGGEAPIIEWVLGKPNEQQQKTVVANSFVEFLYQRVEMELEEDD